MTNEERIRRIEQHLGIENTDGDALLHEARYQMWRISCAVWSARVSSSEHRTDIALDEAATECANLASRIEKHFAATAARREKA